MVYVAGYSDYFGDLTTSLQEEMITRADQAGYPGHGGIRRRSKPVGRA
jgi:hypothetical protein